MSEIKSKALIAYSMSGDVDSGEIVGLLADDGHDEAEAEDAITDLLEEGYLIGDERSAVLSEKGARQVVGDGLA